ncbi:MAG: glycosyltransferase [Lutimaribacter sp.]
MAKHGQAGIFQHAAGPDAPHGPVAPPLHQGAPWVPLRNGGHDTGPEAAALARRLARGAAQGAARAQGAGQTYSQASGQAPATATSHSLQALLHGHQPALAVMASLGPQTCLKRAFLPLVHRQTGAKLLVMGDRSPTPPTELPPPWQGVPVRVAPQADVQNQIAAAFRTTLAQAALMRVPSLESCRNWGQRPRQRLAAIVLALVASVGLIWAFPMGVLVGLTFWAVFTLIVAALLKTAATLAHLLARAPAEKPSVAQAQLPMISVLVPLFQEIDIADHLLHHLNRLDYPHDQLDIVLVLEETDTLTQNALMRAPLPPWIRIVTVPDGHPRTKPRAMNYALDFCHGEIIGIWDAEDAPAPNQLRVVAAEFAQSPADVACLQGVLDYYNPRQNAMARCFTIEYATWFRLILPGMARLGMAIPLGGTTLFFRRDVLEQLGGWDAHNVTEDADLGFRLARHGYRTQMMPTTTHEEANCAPLPWVRQRSRWLKGYMVTWLVHMRHPGLLRQQMGLWRFVGMQAHFITALSQFLLAPLFWSFWLILLGLPHPLQGQLSPSILLAMGQIFVGVELITLCAGLIAVRGSAHRHLLLWVPLMPIYFLMGSLAAYKALWELVCAPFYWDKTQHGLSLRAIQFP